MHKFKSIVGACLLAILVTACAKPTVNQFSFRGETSDYKNLKCRIEVCTIIDSTAPSIWPVETDLSKISIRIYSISKNDSDTIPPTGALAAQEGFVDHSLFQDLTLNEENDEEVVDQTLSLPPLKSGYYYIEFEANGNFTASSLGDPTREGDHYFVDVK